MFDQKRFISNLLEEVGGNKKYGSLVKLILPKNAYIDSETQNFDLETAMEMKTKSFYIDYFDKENERMYCLTVCRNNQREIDGYDIAITDDLNNSVTYYSSISAEYPVDKKFRFTKVGKNGVYTLKISAMKNCFEIDTFICQERYYNQESSESIGEMYRDPELMDLAEHCCLDAESERSFTLPSNLEKAIEYFECMANQFCNDDFWLKREVH